MKFDILDLIYMYTNGIITRNSVQHVYSHLGFVKVQRRFVFVFLFASIFDTNEMPADIFAQDSLRTLYTKSELMV